MSSTPCSRLYGLPALLGGVPQLDGRYLCLLIQPARTPVLPAHAPLDFSVLERHERIALLFSGGKDSLCLWHLLAPWHHRLTVYHLDTGDKLAETQRVVDQYRARTLGRWVDVRSDSRAWRAQHGLPADVVPVHSTPQGMALGDGGSRLIASRLDCCAANRTLPMAGRLLADGVTLMLCGTRREDSGYGSVVAGASPGPHPNSLMVGQGVGRHMILRNWTGEDVAAYLASLGVRLPAYYGGPSDHAPECASCPAASSLHFIRYLKGPRAGRCGIDPRGSTRH